MTIRTLRAPRCWVAWIADTLLSGQGDTEAEAIGRLILELSEIDPTNERIQVEYVEVNPHRESQRAGKGVLA